MSKHVWVRYRLRFASGPGPWSEYEEAFHDDSMTEEEFLEEQSYRCYYDVDYRETEMYRGYDIEIGEPDMDLLNKELSKAYKRMDQLTRYISRIVNKQDDIRYKTV